jgi:methionyl-tRNA formyltransferase
MKLAWIGFHEEGIPALRSVLEAGYEVRAVFTLSREAASGKSGAASYDWVSTRFGIPLYEIESVNRKEVVEILDGLNLDFLFVIGWTELIGDEALAAASGGVIGAHASLLPHNRGRAPVNWAVIKGETITGNTLMWLVRRADRGDIIDQREIPILPYDTCETIYQHVAQTNRGMILRLLQQLSRGERPATPQPDTGERNLPRRSPADGLIDWTRPASELYDFIRAQTRPYPGAFGHFRDQVWRIWNSALLPLSGSLGSPGEILGSSYCPDPGACGQLVACGEGALLLLEVQREDSFPLAGRNLAERDWKGLRWRNQ